MTPTQEDREAALWLCSLTKRQHEILAGLTDAAEERGARMALEAAAKKLGLSQRHAIRQIDPAALKGAE
jgi:hypothetical protein